MSRIGEKPINISEGVAVRVADGGVEVAGVKGKLERKLPSLLKLESREGKLWLVRANNERKAKSLQGLYRSLLINMIKGVSEGFNRDLRLVGTGYRVRLEGEKLIISCGFSHPVEVEPPAGIKFAVDNNELIRISGADKEAVGEVAAKIRAIKPPEPYKGKGIQYEGERVRRKPGKAGKAGVAAGKGVA
jgi:large subunit ribosomal protein L6